MNFEPIKTNLSRQEKVKLQAKGLAKDLTGLGIKLLLLGILAFFLYANAARLWFMITEPTQIDWAIERNKIAQEKKMEFIKEGNAYMVK